MFVQFTFPLSDSALEPHAFWLHFSLPKYLSKFCNWYLLFQLGVLFAPNLFPIPKSPFFLSPGKFSPILFTLFFPGRFVILSIIITSLSSLWWFSLIFRWCSFDKYFSCTLMNISFFWGQKRFASVLYRFTYWSLFNFFVQYYTTSSLFALV